MPIYEYQCGECHQEFECLILGKDQPKCPCCCSAKVERKMSSCGFVSKGSGGQSVKRAAADSSCGSCTSGSCASCGH